jgi:hypothetical protein
MVLLGASALITGLAEETLVAEPDAFVAVTAERKVLPTSASLRTYVVATAPLMLLQLPPLLLQRCHWYAYSVMSPFQLPLVLASTLVSVNAGPLLVLTLGGVVTLGTASTAIVVEIEALLPTLSMPLRT